MIDADGMGLCFLKQSFGNADSIDKTIEPRPTPFTRRVRLESHNSRPIIGSAGILICDGWIMTS